MNDEKPDVGLIAAVLFSAVLLSLVLILSGCVMSRSAAQYGDSRGSSFTIGIGNSAVESNRKSVQIEKDGDRIVFKASGDLEGAQTQGSVGAEIGSFLGAAGLNVVAK